VNLLRFIGPPPFQEGPHSTRGGLLGAGHSSHIRSDAARPAPEGQRTSARSDAGALQNLTEVVALRG